MNEGVNARMCELSGSVVTLDCAATSTAVLLGFRSRLQCWHQARMRTDALFGEATKIQRILGSRGASFPVLTALVGCKIRQAGKTNTPDNERKYRTACAVPL
jgi:hypothetical protein